MKHTAKSAPYLAIGALFVAALSITTGTHLVGAQTSTVTIQNFAFTPSSVTIPVGGTVTWTNQDSTAHTATSDSGAWNSGTLQPGQSFSFTFTTPGTYTYHCSIHPFMLGTIIVQSTTSATTTATASSPAASTSTPTSVSTSVPPTSTPTAPKATATPKPVPALSISVAGSLHVGRSSALQVTVRDSRHHAVSGARVTLDARSAGVSRVLSAKTNGKGGTKFAKVRPTRTGTAKLTASKHGYKSKTKKLKVR